MKKKAFLVVGVLVALGIVGFTIKGCLGKDESNSTADTNTNTKAKKKPLNLSIYLDLSSRLVRKMTPSQTERDIAIVEHLAKRFKDEAIKKRILPCNDRIKVFFYPSPQDQKVALLSDNLELDLSKTELPQKKVRLKEFEGQFKQSLEQIYQSTLANAHWVGSDIWGFFNKPIDTYCIKKDYRNVLVILTDGYIDYIGNRKQEGNAYSYLSDKILTNP